MTATGFQSLQEEPGVFVLDILLRLMKLDVDIAELKRRAGGGPFGVPEMKRFVNERGLTARHVKCSWDELASLPLPGIASLRGGGFLLLGRVTADHAAVLLAGASRPATIARSDFESSWDGGILTVRKRGALGIIFWRIKNAWSARITSIFRRAFQAVRASWQRRPANLPIPSAAAGGAAVLVFSDHARKLGRAISNRAPTKRSDELAFLPAALEIVETPPSPLGRTVAFSIAGVFAVALLWAAIGTVDIVAVAPGKLVPNGRTKIIQPLEAGVIRAIHVRDGQSVKAGDPLIELDTTISAAELARLKSDLMASRFDIARINAALKGGPDPVASFVPPDQTQSSLIDTQRRLLTSQAAEQKAKVAAIDSQLKQKEAERVTLNATIDKLKATLSPLQQRVSIREQLFNKELGSKITYLTELQDLVGQQQEIVVQESRLREADAGISALAETRSKTTAEYERSLFEELAKSEQKAASLVQEVVKAEQRTSLERLAAPIDGSVQQLAVHTIGGVVTPAQTLMMVVPNDSHLEIEAMISNRDIGFVEVGQEAAVKIDTFSFTRYGLLEGQILSISQDAISRNKPADRNGENPGTQNATSEPTGQELVYAARMSIDRNHMDIEGKRIMLSPGMAVTTEIKTGSRTVLSYLLSPLARYRQESLRER